MIVGNYTTKKNLKMAATRDGFGEGLLELGRKNKNVVALTADLSESTRTHLFQEAFPERFIEVGVAEQNLVTVASGLAAAGKIPFATSYAVFSPGRNWEQIRTTIAYNNQPVKIVSTHAGLNVGPDGATHQALEDIALMRVLPNMTVIVPTDSREAHKATLAAAKSKGPVYIRLTRDKSPIFTTPGAPFHIGKANILRKGSDVTVVGSGPVLYDALVAASKLKNATCEVINLHTVKPIDRRTLLHSVKKTRCVVTIEEHQAIGGVGSAVAEVLSQEMPIPIEMVAVQDSFGESGESDELLEKFGLTEKSITTAIHKALKRK